VQTWKNFCHILVFKKIKVKIKFVVISQQKHISDKFSMLEALIAKKHIKNI